MTDRHQLEQEIRRECGEDFLETLRQVVADKKSSAKRKRASHLMVNIVGYLLITYIILIAPALVAIEGMTDYVFARVFYYPFDYYPDLPVVILYYLIVASILGFFRFFRSGKGEIIKPPSNSVWFYYINDIADASPRAWICHGLDNGTWLSGADDAEACLEWDGLKSLCYHKPAPVKDWVHQQESPVRIQEVYQRSKYYYLYTEFENKSVPPSISTPKSIEPSWLEEDDCIEFPELNELNRHVLQSNKKRLAMELNIEEIEIETVSSRASSKTSRNYFLNIMETDSGANLSSKELTETEAKKLVRRILFCFFAKPWLGTPVTKELPWRTRKGDIVGLRLIYIPNEVIKVEHLDDLENSTINIKEVTPHDATKLAPGYHQDTYNGLAYEYDYCPTDHYDEPYLSLTFPLMYRGQKLESGVLGQEAKDLIYKMAPIIFHKQKQPLSGVKRIFYRLSQIIFKPMLFTCNSPEFFNQCHLESPLENRPLIKWILDDQSRRESINSFFSTGYNNIDISYGEITLHLEGDQARDINVNSLMSQTVPYLTIFNDEFIEKLPDYAQQQKRNENLRKTINTAVPALLITLFFLFRPDKYNLVADTPTLILYTLPIWLPVYAVLVYWTWWTTSFIEKNRGLWKLSSWSFGLLTILGLTIGMVSYANTTWDSMLSKPQTVSIFKKVHSDSSQILILKHWNSSQGIIHLTVNKSLYNQATPAVDQLLLHLKPGYLGFEWIESYELITPDAEASLEKVESSSSEEIK